MSSTMTVMAPLKLCSIPTSQPNPTVTKPTTSKQLTNTSVTKETKETKETARIEYYSDPQCLMTIGSLRMETRELRNENEYLRTQSDALQAVLNVASITKLFNKVAPGSVYHRYFMGRHRRQILLEVITRYNSCMDAELMATCDTKVVANIMRRIGNECRDGVLRTSFGDTIYFDGG